MRTVASAFIEHNKLCKEISNQANTITWICVHGIMWEKTEKDENKNEFVEIHEWKSHTINEWKKKVEKSQKYRNKQRWNKHQANEWKKTTKKNITRINKFKVNAINLFNAMTGNCNNNKFKFYFFFVLLLKIKNTCTNTHKLWATWLLLTFYTLTQFEISI